MSTDLTITTPEFTLADGVSIYVVSSAIYSSIDTEDADVEDDVKEIISKLIIRDIKSLSYGEALSVGTSFVDSLFQEAKEVLDRSQVDLMGFKITEVVKTGELNVGIKEYSENIGEHEPGVEGDGKDTADEEDVETFEYIISIIPEETPEITYKTETREVIMDGNSMEALTSAIGNFQAPAPLQVEFDEPEVYAKPERKIEVGHGDLDENEDEEDEDSTEIHTSTFEVGHADSGVHSDDDFDDNVDGSMEALMAALGNFEAAKTVEVDHDEPDVQFQGRIGIEVGSG